jgi:phospholipid N-methyltransferase
MATRRSTLEGGIFMFRQFLRDRRIASIKATSPYLVRRICGRIDFSRRRVVVEFGPGLGCFTRVLLQRLSQDSRLIVFETNPEFARRLRKIRDPRLLVAFGSAEAVTEVLDREGLAGADVVLSGIPFSHFPEVRKMKLLRDARAILGDDGVFLAYQSSAQLEKYLKRVFLRVRVERELFHIPPLVVLEAGCRRAA